MAKGPQRRRSLKPTSRKTGRTTFALNQIYASRAGLADHWNAASKGWPDYNAFIVWAGKARVAVLRRARIIHSLWDDKVRSHRGKTMMTLVFTVHRKRVAEGKLLLASHAAWVKQAHARTGDDALLRYDVTSAREPSSALNRRSRPTKLTSFSLTQVFARPEGLQHHWKQLATEWKDYKKFVRWARRGKISSLHGAPITHSLWE